MGRGRLADRHATGPLGVMWILVVAPVSAAPVAVAVAVLVTLPVAPSGTWTVTLYVWVFPFASLDVVQQ